MNDFFRLHEWWSVKVSLFFGILSLLALHYQILPSEYGLLILESFLVLFPIAAWANVINDYGDLRSDERAGKPNRLSKWTPTLQVLVTFGTIPLLFLIPFIYGYNMGNLLFPGLIVISFIMYSIPPFRFKSAGWSGVFMDALATQVFPALYIIQLVGSRHQSDDGLLLVSAFSWLLFAGLRLHLVHQFMDLENDQKAGLTTAITKHGVNWNQKWVRNFVFPMEVVSLLSVVWYWHQEWLLGVLVIYFALQFLKRRKLGIRHTLFIVNGPERVWLSEFYNYYILFSALLIAIVQIDYLYSAPLFLFLGVFYSAYRSNLKESIHLMKFNVLVQRIKERLKKF